MKIRWIVGGAAVLSGALALGNISLTQVSSDPFTNATSQHKTEVEPDTYSFGSTIVSAFQVGRFFDGGSSDIGWSTSKDGGVTWSHGFLPGVTKFQDGGVYDRASDASVTYDAAHKVWLISSLVLHESPMVAGAGVMVSRSKDGGLSWEKALPVAIASNGGFYDKNWINCDNSAKSPFYGHCYTEWDDNSLGNLVQMSTSSDGGVTWSAPAATADRATGLGGQPVVQSNGTVIVPFANANDTALASFKSTDGGISWSQISSIADATPHDNSGGLRTEALPSAEIDSAGMVYVAWQDCRFEAQCAANDIVFSKSGDGVTWTSPVRIPLDSLGSGVDHFIPGLGVDAGTGGNAAHLALTYYYYPKSDCTADTCELFVGASVSPDGGNSWSVPVQIAGPMTLKSIPVTSQGNMVGDYISTSFILGNALPVFAVSLASGEVAMHAPQMSHKFSGAQSFFKIKNEPVFDMTYTQNARRNRGPITRF